MKRRSLSVGILLLLAMSTTVQAQQRYKVAKKKPPVKRTVVATNKSRAPRADAGNTVHLISNGEYKAYKNQAGLTKTSGAAENALRITDPTIRTYNAIANGANIKMGSSGVPGVPKGRYGYANGHITLLPNGATSIGTTTGSGSVGTGSSPGSVGTIGPGMGVNGRNPYAGPDVRGTRVRSYTELLRSDSIKIVPLPRQ